MVDGCRQEKGVPHVRTHDDRHTGMPRPLPQLRRPLGLLRRPVEDPRTCEARRGNAIRGRGMGRGVGFGLHVGNACIPSHILAENDRFVSQLPIGVCSVPGKPPLVVVAVM